MNQMDNATVPGGSSYIDPDSTVEGTIRTDHDLRVEGSVAGTIQCEGVLIVAEGALVDAEIDASSIVVAGEMSGTVRCRGRLEIRSTGIVKGDVRTGALVIHEGARYEGQIAMEAVEAAPAIESEDDPGESAVLETDEDSSETEYSFLRRFAPEDDDALPEDET
ncbi:MAG: polymer-forming cytoskeletal protein [Thermomicrobiales bacterium]